MMKVMKDWGRKEKILFYGLMIIGVLLVAMSYLWRKEIGSDMSSPYKEMNLNINMHSVDNFYNKNSDKYTGEVVSRSSLVYRTDRIRSEDVEIHGLFDVRTLSGSKIVSVEREYLVNIKNGTVSDQSMGNGGYLMGPGKRSKADFLLRHFSGSDLVLMKFEKEEKINDLLTYKFVGKSKNDLSKDFAFLPEVPEKYNIENSFDISWWIEPYTGLLVKFSENGQNTFVDPQTKAQVHPRNKYVNEITDESILSLVQYARLQSLNVVANTIVVPVLFIILGFTLILGVSFWRGFLGGYGGNDIRSGVITRMITYVVPLVTLLATLLFVWVLKIWNEDLKYVEFGQETEQIERTISRRFDMYLNALLGGRGLFLASDEVNKDEWKSYVDALIVQSNFPGIAFFGFNQWVEATDEADFAEMMKEDGYEEYKFIPDERGVEGARVLARFLEPITSDIVGKLGFDLLSEENRRKALISARDTASPAITGKVVLIADLEKKEPGVIIFLPVYEKGADISTVEQRRESHIGYISGAIRVKDLMTDLFGQNQPLGFDVYDTNDDKEENLMYTSPIPSAMSEDIHEQRKVMYVLGRPWMIVYKTPLSVLKADNRVLGLIVIAGVSGSLLIFVTLNSLVNSNRRAKEIADDLTRDLKGANEKLALTLSGTGVGTWNVNEDSRMVEMGAHSGRLLGYEGEVVKPIDEIVALFDDGEIDKLRQLLSGSTEIEDATVRISDKKNKEVKWVMFKGRPIYDENDGVSTQEAGIMTDVTNIKTAQMKLEKKSMELEKINELMVGRELKMKELKEKLKQLGVKD